CLGCSAGWDSLAMHEKVVRINTLRTSVRGSNPEASVARRTCDTPRPRGDLQPSRNADERFPVRSGHCEKPQPQCRRTLVQGELATTAAASKPAGKRRPGSRPCPYGFCFSEVIEAPNSTGRFRHPASLRQGVSAAFSDF